MAYYGSYGYGGFNAPTSFAGYGGYGYGGYGSYGGNVYGASAFAQAPQFGGYHGGYNFAPQVSAYGSYNQFAAPAPQAAYTGLSVPTYGGLRAATAAPFNPGFAGPRTVVAPVTAIPTTPAPVPQFQSEFYARNYYSAPAAQGLFGVVSAQNYTSRSLFGGWGNYGGNYLSAYAQAYPVNFFLETPTEILALPPPPESHVERSIEKEEVKEEELQDPNDLHFDLNLSRMIALKPVIGERFEDEEQEGEYKEENEGGEEDVADEE